MNCHWYCLYTKPKHEDSVATLLSESGIEVLNPLLRRKRYLRRRLVDVVEPFFPSYVFALFDCETSYRLVRYTRGVRYIVGKESPAEVHDTVIAMVKEHMNEEGHVILRPPDLSRGDRVLVEDGPFRGFMGVFERELSDSDRVLILLATLQGTVRLELDKTLLKKR